MDYFSEELWAKWANNNYQEFESLKDGSKIAMLLPNTDNLIILEKGNDISVTIDDKNSFEFPFAEIAFKFDEKTIDMVLNDSTFETFKKLSKNDEVGVLAFVSADILNKYKYISFLKSFGLEINTGCSCGCC